MPIRPATLFRLVLVLALATHVFYMYGLARTMGESFGADTRSVIAGAAVALVMLVPLVWAVTLPDLPEIIARQVRGRHRWTHGRCPSCGYSLAQNESPVCPECGAPAAEPSGYQVTAATVRRYVVLNLLAWVIGCAGSELWISTDESSFRVEAMKARAAGYEDYLRAVRWPGRGLYLWAEGDGFARVRGGVHLLGRSGAVPITPSATEDD